MRPLTSLLLLLALSGCGVEWIVDDPDGDGYTRVTGDCDEGKDGAAFNPGADEIWYDAQDQNCDGKNDFDKDGDGHASVFEPDPTGLLPSDDCWDDPDTIPARFAADNPEDQLDASQVFPGAAETWYDGIDQDCGGDDDYDQDGDGHRSAARHTDGDDCFDAVDEPFDNPGGLAPEQVNPEAAETWYDGTDADCAGDDDFDQDGDGYALDDECDDTDASRFPNPEIEEIWYDGVDDNCDGNDGDQDGDGWYIADYAFEVPAAYEAGDCWDDPGDAAAWDPLPGFAALNPEDVHPDATETWYDGLDQDCAEDGDFDQDGDGQTTSEWPDREGTSGTDCDDTRTDVYTGAPDTWYDGVDSDCAGNDDYDQDGDGYALDDECDDAEPTVNPGAAEVCGNRVDEDCSGSTNDEGATGCTTFYADADADGFGGDDSACLCESEGTYTATEPEDCDDADGAVNPGAEELCSTSGDDDCDGDATGLNAADCSDWYVDADNDGYGTGTAVCACEVYGAYDADNGDDCNDASAGVNPAATEACDDEDDDCDGVADDGLTLYYADADSDGYGGGTGDCSITTGLTAAEDCNDDSAYAYPGATEICDGIANDCDTEASWTEADEDGVVTYFAADGTWTDLSSTFGAASTTVVSLESAGTYNLCAGTYTAKLVGSNDTVDLVGVYGADVTTLDPTSTTGAVVTIVDGQVTMSGLTITGGYGTNPNGYGGGIYVTAASARAYPTLTLEDVVVTGNSSTYYGGGIAVYSYGILSMLRTEVSDNTSNEGGGIWVAGNASLDAEDCDIHDNTAAASGGGLYLDQGGDAALDGTNVYDNDATAGDGGGIYLEDGQLTLSGGSVTDNTSADDGGGLFITNGTASCSSTDFARNSAALSGHGGAVYLSNHASATASFAATTCDFGTGADDNSPTDITVKTSGSTYQDYSSYGSSVTTTCTNASDSCTP
jgi:hypothetical protein